MSYKEKMEAAGAAMDAFAEGAPEFMESFGGLCEAGFSGPLDAKTMEMISVAVAVARKCEPCIYAHVPNAVEAGVTREELTAALKVASLFCGGPGVAYSGIALAVYDELTAGQK